MQDKSSAGGPLRGVNVVELAGLGPGPYCGQLLADMGADVILIERPGGSAFLSHNRGKRSIALDLRREGAAEIVLRLVRGADVLVEGLRPGVTERLGVGPEACHAINKKLVYGRMTGWGQTGPWAKMAGHDINYISITGVLNAMGEAGKPPPPPLNLVGDFGGGSLFLLSGILAGLVNAQRTGVGDVVDAAIIDGVNSMMGFVHSLASQKLWSTARHRNFLDGGAPYYRCYKTADDLFMAVGCIEQQFFTEMLSLLAIEPEAYGAQNDMSAWPAQHKLLEECFASRTRDEWAKIFDGRDACVTPVLDYEEALTHPQNAARESLVRENDVTMAGIAPRLAGADKPVDTHVPIKGADMRNILEEAGYSETEIAALAQAKITR